MAAKIHIIIVNWNSGAWLRGCVESVLRHGGGVVDNVVVVDNGSIDGSADLAPHPVLSMIRTGRNLGFAKACNIGAAGAEAPYLLFLNPDAALLEGSLATALDFMEGPDAADVAACGIRLVDEHGETHHHTVSFPTPSTIFTHDRMRTRFDHLHSREVDHVIGAFYLIRTEVFRSLGGFDERFFVYLEDLDLSLRIRAHGWKIHYLAEASAFHKGGGTSERVKARRLFYALSSRIVYARKHFRIGGLAYTVGVTFSAELAARIGRAVARRSLQELADTLRAYGMLVGQLPRLLVGKPEPVDSRSGAGASGQG